MNFKTFDLNLLRVLDALLTTHSTTQAARKLGLSQPAVSSALARLRLSLGDPLFVRHGRRIVPTENALRLQVPLRLLLDDAERMLCGTGHFDAANAQDRFRIAGSDFFAEMLMPALAADVAREAPGIRVQLVDLVPENFVETLERHQIDLALLPQTVLPAWVDSHVLFQSSFVVIARRGHPRLRAARITAGDVMPLDLFCDLGHVLFSPEGKLEGPGDAALSRVGRARRVVMTLPVFSGVYNTVAGSDTIALIPRQLAERVGARVGLDILLPPVPIDPAVISMVWHKRATTSPAHRWLRDKVHNATRCLDVPAARMVGSQVAQ
ncbi:LysR family transcriptional regulator [Thalassococcus sp. CAU 1522]|uniref:LysR family transcriptional regulator n=1 Tax=Thalassococcus arenae TaxID=2851652 RepID=A0ABS6N6R2_9RHOB|nr:LysR family transcriptional regulator [Thalassococcus arenae]MBV2359705.1 LysR family transcriptional regulator [Thalassococcus arenae]